MTRFRRLKSISTKLERTVALKFLTAHLLKDDEARKRFHREAKASASLSHPNICRVFEIDDIDGQTFIAMEFVEGEDLDKRIEQSPLKIPEALDIAQQIAKGLEAAHEKGVVHRDIKPQNVMVASKGHVTIMDFGLAQLTQASLLTRPDQTMGTTFYMSPEQTEGSGTDHRTDIWSLGVVLYEMVSGQRPFKGDYDKAIMYSILNEEPEPITALRTGVPMELENYVGKCLAKNPSQRYQGATELGVDLANLAEGLEHRGAAKPQAGQGATDKPPELNRLTRERISWALTALLALAVAVMALRVDDNTASAPTRASFSFSAPDFDPEDGSRAKISPDGKHIVYSAGVDSVSLWIRNLDDEQPRELAHTEGAIQPFWSPDGRHLAFAADGQLKWQPALTSSAGSQTTRLESRPRRSVPGSASTLPGPPGPGSMESKADVLCLLPWEFPPSLPVGVDSSAAITPREVVREIPPAPRLRSPQTSLHQFPERRYCALPADRLPEGFPVCRRERTTPKSAKTIQPSP